MENRLFLLEEPAFNWDDILKEDMEKKFAEDAKKINNRQFTLVGPDTFKAFELNMFEWVTEDEATGQMVPSTLATELKNLRQAVSADQKEEAMIQADSMTDDIDSDNNDIALEGVRPLQGAGALYSEEAIEKFVEVIEDAVVKPAISYKQVIELTGDVDGANKIFRIESKLDIIVDDAKVFVNGVREPFTLLESAGYFVGIQFDEAPALHSEVILGGDILTAGPEDRLAKLKAKAEALTTTEDSNKENFEVYKQAMDELSTEVKEALKVATESVASEQTTRKAAIDDFNKAKAAIESATNSAEIKAGLEGAKSAYKALYKSAHEHTMALNSTKVNSSFAVSEIAEDTRVASESRLEGSQDSNERRAEIEKQIAELTKAIDAIVSGGAA
jgi:hypothetical protein